MEKGSTERVKALLFQGVLEYVVFYLPNAIKHKS